MKRPDRLRRRLLDRICYGDDGGKVSVDGGIERRLTLVGKARGGIGEGGYVMAKLGHVAVSADFDPCAACFGGNAETRHAFERGECGQRQSLRLGGLDDRARDRMFGLRLAGGARQIMSRGMRVSLLNRITSSPPRKARKDSFRRKTLRSHVSS